MSSNTMNDFFMFLTSLMTEHAGFFQTMGQNMFRGFALILIVWFGVKGALASASGGPTSFRWDHFASLLLTISLGYTMITFYSNPIPGIGLSFYHLIVDQGLDLSNRLNHSLVDDLWGRMNSIYWGMEMPALAIVLNVLEVIRYAVTVLCLAAAQAAVFGVIAFGYVAMAVAVLLGPVFIPFFIVPGMEWMFWGWLKALLQYSFYPVVANAYLYVFGNLLIHFIDSHPPPYDGARVAILFFPLVMLLVAFTYGILKIPSLVNSLFTGRSGESAIPNIL